MVADRRNQDEYNIMRNYKHAKIKIRFRMFVVSHKPR